MRHGRRLKPVRRGASELPEETMAWTNTEITEFERLIKEKNKKFERFKESSLHALIALLKTTNPSKDAVQAEIDKIPDKKDEKYKAALTYLRKHFPGLDEVVKGGVKLKGFAGVLDEQNRMNRAVLAMSRCYEVVGMCQKAMGKVVANTVSSKSPAHWSEPERRATELFQKWLDGSRKSASVDRVRTVFNSMEDALRNQNWEVVLYGTPEDPDPENLGNNIAGAFAFVRPGENAYRIYLGASFWKEGAARIDVPTVTHAKAPETSDQWQQEKRTKTAMDAAIVTTIHELCHVRAISGGTAITDVKPSPYSLAKCKQRAETEPHLALTNAENYAQFASALLMEKHFF
jgi:hypothetical protein